MGILSTQATNAEAMGTEPPMEQPMDSKPPILSNARVVPKITAQEEFDKFIINALKIIHDGTVTSGLIKRIRSSKNAIDSIGNVALDILTRIDASAEASGRRLKFGTIVHGMNVIVGELVNICEAAGSGKIDPEQKYQAFSWAMSKYLANAVKTGKITKDELKKVTDMLRNPKGSDQPPQTQPGQQQPQQPNQAMPQGNQAPMPQGTPQPMQQPQMNRQGGM